MLSAVAKIVFLFCMLPNSRSGFGPDEGTFASLAKYVAESRPVDDFPVYGQGLYSTTKSFILPGSFLIKLGVDSFTAVRLISSIYGLLSIVILAMCMIALLRSFENTLSTSENKRLSLITVALAIWTFLPSNFLWSSLGLRESASHFWTLTTFYFLIKILTDQVKFKILVSLALICSMVLGFGARNETSLIFSLCALTITSFLLPKRSYWMPVVLIISGVLLGQLYINNQSEVKAYELVRITNLSDSEVSLPGSKQDGGKCIQDGQIVKIESENYICRASFQKEEGINPLISVVNRVGSISEIENRQKLNRIEAQSSIRPLACDIELNWKSMKTCIIPQIAIRAPLVLFRPLPFLDSGSKTQQFASIENLFWIFLFLFAIVSTTITISYSSWAHIRALLILFSLSFTSALALFEGNLGTAFRHKSTLLWPLLVLSFINLMILTKTKVELKFDSKKK